MVQQPDGSQLMSTHITTVPIRHPSLPQAATSAHVIPGLANPLLSIGQFCDGDCTAIFTKQKAHILHGPLADNWLNSMPQEAIIITGERDSADTLWHLPLHADPRHTHPLQENLCCTLRPSATIAQRVAYYHACLGSPTLSTWCNAINAGHLTTFPGLTTSQVRKHFPNSIATYMGHLDQTRQEQYSTKSHSRDLYVGIIDTMEAPTVPHRPGTIYSDATGKFIIQSSQGNNYILVVFDTDSNYIFAEAMPSRTAYQILKAYTKVHTFLLSRGITPAMHIMDNEVSDLLRNYITQHNANYQIVAPHQHRANAAERAIRTFKNHFISTLCTCDPEFPLHLWDRLLDQSVLTLNLLRTSTINPKLSAYAQIHGAFNFTSTPIGPPGTKVIIHEKPQQRGTWSPHGTMGWYLGPAMDHYRCYVVYIPSTRTTRICDTFAWLPTSVTMPTASSVDMAMAAAYDLTQALLHPSPASAICPLSDTQTTALRELACLFENLTSPQTNYTDDSNHGLPRLPAAAAAESGNMTTNVPRVETVPTETDALRMGDEPDIACDPRVPWAEPLSTAINEPLSSPLTTNVSVESTSNDLSYTTYNHNGPQRRHRTRYNRRHRNPISQPTTGSPTTPPGLQAVPTPIPSLTAPTINPRHPLRRSSRGVKLVRFDPKTHRILSLIKSDNTSADTLSNHQNEIRLRHALKGPEASIWERAVAMELGRLAQGVPGLVEGTDTIRFIPHSAKPTDRISSYCRTVCSINMNKAETHRVRLTYGGDRSDYEYEVSTPTADTTTVKLHFNAIVSTPGARHMTLDIKNFYLNTPLDRHEYMRIPVAIIPPSIIDHYNLLPLVANGHVMVEIVKGIYGLPQAGILAKKLLDERLLQGGYKQANHTPGLYRHHNSGLQFTLWVDDFSILYTNKSDVDDLLTLLRQHYEVTTDWTGSKYLGLTLSWDYIRRTVDISMPGYIQRLLERFTHPPPTRPQHSPHAWLAPSYGSQLTTAPDESPLASPSQIKRLQQIIGCLLFYARMVDMTMLVAINTIASQQSKATESTVDATTHLLNYCATHPEATVRFSASDMILHIVSDASYLSASGARSRLGGYFFMSHALHPSPPTPETPAPTFNGPILVNSSIIPAVVSSAAEAELGALFYNAKDGAMLRATLEDMGYPQPATPIQADNECAIGLSNGTVKQKRSKAIDMRFYWVRDRVK